MIAQRPATCQLVYAHNSRHCERERSKPGFQRHRKTWFASLALAMTRVAAEIRLDRGIQIT
jgi:hypothetical protein